MKAVVFKSIPGYEGLYAASEDGRIKSLERTKICGRGGQQVVRERLLKQQVSTGGYPMVHLCKGGARRMVEVHRLVALAWLGLPGFDGATVNHRDGSKRNNSVANLEWATQIQNITHAIETGLSPRKGEANPNAKFTDVQIAEIRQRAASGEAQAALAKEHGVGSLCVGRAVRRVTWAHI